MKYEVGARVPVRWRVSQRQGGATIWAKIRREYGGQIAPGLENLATGVQEGADGKALLDIRAKVTPEVLEAIRQAGGELIYAHEQFDAIRARLSLDALEALAGLNEVKFIRPAEEPMTGGNTANRSAMSGNAGAMVAP